MLCLKERSPQKKKHSNSKFKGKNSGRFLFTWTVTVCSSKSSFHAFLPPLLFGGDGGCRGSRFVTPCLVLFLNVEEVSILLRYLR